MTARSGLDEIGTSDKGPFSALRRDRIHHVKHQAAKGYHRPVEKTTFMSFHVSEGDLKGYSPPPGGFIVI